ncbi:hypothetical protein JT358_01855 [Micrococcales bacterium 31B]|nr:hypothetical protein [Micrococcales bacterium 31B]
MTTLIVFAIVCLGLSVLIVAGIALSSINRGEAVFNDHRIPRKARRVTETDELFAADTADSGLK